jgi:hypothetical protein
MPRYRGKISAVSDGNDAPAGWVKVALASGSNETDWCEYPQLTHSSGFGLWLPPTVGLPVLVDFADEDEMQEEPLIVRSSYDEETVPPSDDLELVTLKLPEGVPVCIQVGDLKLTMRDSKIVIEAGGSTEYRLARADRVEARLQALESWAGGHTHITTSGAFGAITAVGGPTSPPPGTAANDTATGLARVKE